MQPAAALTGCVGVEIRAYYTPLVFNFARPEITMRVRSNGFIEGNSAVSCGVDFGKRVDVVDKFSRANYLTTAGYLWVATLANNDSLLP